MRRYAILWAAKKEGIAERVEFNAWFEKIAKSLESGEQSLDQVKATLTQAIPGLKGLWSALESISVWSDGLQFWFADNDNGIRDICIRPSGTDAKTKIYFDGTDKQALKATFEEHLQSFRP